MIVGTTPIVAALPPAAHVALVHRVRIRRLAALLVARRHPRQQIGAHRPVVGGIVGHAERLHAEVWRGVRVGRGRRHHHVEALRRHALQVREQVCVGRELQDGAAARLTRQLGVVRLVAPRAESAGSIDADQHVGATEPARHRQRRLVDGVRAGRHRRARGRHLRRQRSLLRDLHHVATVGAQRVEIALLVLESAICQRLRERVDPHRRRERAVHSGEIERGAMTAAEERGEVGGREDELVGQEHGWRNYRTCA